MNVKKNLNNNKIIEIIFDSKKINTKEFFFKNDNY